MPKSLTQEVSYDSRDGHALAFRGDKKFTPVQGGIFDRELLCGKCDGVLGDHENYAKRTLRKLRQEIGSRVSGVYHAKEVDGDKLLQFACGVVWKFAATKSFNGKISIGPWRDRLGSYCFSGSDNYGWIDGFFARITLGDDDVYFYRNPRPVRINGLKFILFIAGGFQFYVKIDKRGFSSQFVENHCNIRSRGEVSVPVVPAGATEEGRRLLGMQRAKGDLYNFLTSRRSK